MDRKVAFDIIDSALAGIAREQRADGGFASLSSAKRDDFSRAVQRNTVFFPANILACLNETAKFENFWNRSFSCGSIQKRIAGFLQAERGDAWSMNYWSKRTEERATIPYPDDWDDTAVALAALHGFDKNQFHGAELADIGRMLVAAEMAEGGPYRTWIAGAAATKEDGAADLVVNSNIGYFLSLLGIQLPNLRMLVEQAIIGKRLSSRYYPGFIQAAYFAARFYRRDRQSREMARMIKKALEKDQPGILEGAMGISALVNLGFSEWVPHGAVEEIIEVARIGTWRPCAFCMDPAVGGKARYAGSAALTAAFVAEAIAKYCGSGDLHEMPLKKFPVPDALGRIKAEARDRCSAVPSSLQRLVLNKIETTVDSEIVELPYLLCRALGERGAAMPEKLTETLALANLYGWIAYAVYDDLLDGEGGPSALPAAVYCSRELTLRYASLGGDFLGLFERVMNGIDDANAWEQMHCRMKMQEGIISLPAELPFVPLSRLADRSLGHALPAVALLVAAGYRIDSCEVDGIFSFFRYYLIARQLHDDAHDWEEDLMRGRLNAVNARLLRGWCARNSPRMRGGLLDFKAYLPELRNFFWRREIEPVVADILSYTRLAKSSLSKAGVLSDARPLAELLERLECAAKRTLEERGRAIDFLRGISGAAGLQKNALISEAAFNSLRGL